MTVTTFLELDLHLRARSWCKLLSKLVSDTTSLDQSINVVLLSLKHSVLETESCGRYHLEIVEDDIQGELLSTYTVTITTVTIDLYFHEVFHLLVEA